jgi:hypothetical protein
MPRKEGMEYSKKRVNLNTGELVWFSFKAELKERPLLILSAVLIFSIMITGFLLRAAEYPADELRGGYFGY